MKIELKNIKVYSDMSEETTAFSADIFINGRKAGYAKNDGRGGCTEHHSYPSFFETMRSAELFIAEQPDIVYPADDIMGELIVKSNMENWIDFQVANNQHEKHLKRLAKDMTKGICYGNSAMYSCLSWKNYTLAQLLDSPVGKQMVQTQVDKLKAKGERILNDNLVGISL